MNENITGINEQKQQMEMGLEAGAPARCPRKNQPRRSRAHWWFQQMRVLVNSAVDWRPAPPARPEQTYLTLSGSK